MSTISHVAGSHSPIPILNTGSKAAPVQFTMGLTLSRLFGDKLWGKKAVRIIIVGLHEAGKSTILHKLNAGEVVTSTPAPGTVPPLISLHAHTSPLRGLTYMFRIQRGDCPV